MDSQNLFFKTFWKFFEDRPTDRPTDRRTKPSLKNWNNKLCYCRNRRHDGPDGARLYLDRIFHNNYNTFLYANVIILSESTLYNILIRKTSFFNFQKLLKTDKARYTDYSCRLKTKSTRQTMLTHMCRHLIGWSNKLMWREHNVCTLGISFSHHIFWRQKFDSIHPVKYEGDSPDWIQIVDWPVLTRQLSFSEVRPNLAHWCFLTNLSEESQLVYDHWLKLIIINFDFSRQNFDHKSSLRNNASKYKLHKYFFHFFLFGLKIGIKQLCINNKINYRKSN